MKKVVSNIYLFLVFIFLYAPIFTMTLFSFNNSKSMSRWNGFTLKWYKELFHDERIMTALFYTIVVAIIASVIATIIGTLGAIGIDRMTGAKRKIITNINYLPVLNPDIVTAVALMALFVFIKLDLGFISMLLAHITFDIPYVVLAVLPKIKQLPENIYEAAIDLGAKPLYAIRKVIIPQIKTGIMSGFLIAFTMSIDDFVISFFNTGNGVTNLSIEIYSMARIGINPAINALSTIMFICVFMLLIIANRKKPRRRGDINEEVC